MRTLVAVFFCFLCAQSAQAREAIWIEGEDTFVDNFNNHGWYSSSGLALDLLSPGTVGSEAGGWLTHFANDAEADLKTPPAGAKRQKS